MASETVQVNRAAVLTMWGAAVAARIGYDWEEGLTLGRALAGLTAQSKGRRLGIFKPKEAKKKGLGEEFWVEICGRPLPAKQTEEGVRAVVKDEAIDPSKVRRYLRGKFGEHYEAVRDAMLELAESYTPKELSDLGFELYEKFRPEVARGKKGWGQKGKLDLTAVRQLAKG